MLESAFPHHRTRLAFYFKPGPGVGAYAASRLSDPGE